MNSIAPSDDRLAFEELAQDIGSQVRDGRLSGSGGGRGLWGDARARGLVDVADVIDKAVATNGHDADRAPIQNTTTTTKKPYKLVLARDITAEGTLKVFLIDGFLGRDETSIWYGAPECGKSTAKIDAACHIAAGRPWCGRAVMQGA